MPVIGTAGHVDHGKSTLVHRLTGRDPDRWAEEKERGLTIDLGFAWTRLPGGMEVSFVDVPGHEHFIKNMLAGIEAIDVALMVVAADEGWMPQSEEHLAVLDLLETRLGVVALTKSDRVDAELLELAALETAEKLEGTSLEGAQIIPVSAVTGEGIDDLVVAVTQLVEALPAAATNRPRLWVDRSFSITGAGTVVTGTLLGGHLRTGDRVAIWPGGGEVRIRGLQSHERETETAEPGTRVAVNLTGVDRDDVGRGAMLGRVDQWEPTRRCSVSISAARYVEELTDRGSYQLHVGSAAIPVRVRLLAPGIGLLELSDPLPLAAGDRFILRETGRRLVVAGGRILDPSPPAKGRSITAGAGAIIHRLVAGPDAIADALLEVRGHDSAERLDRHSGGGSPTGGVRAGDRILSTTFASRLTDRAIESVRSFHDANPLRPGMPLASLATTLAIPIPVLEALSSLSDELTVESASVRLASFQVDRANRDTEWVAARSALEASGLEVPRVSELGIDRELMHALIRDGELVKVSDEFVFLPDQIRSITEQLADMADGFTVSEFKDRTGLSRKYAVPFLEWADRSGLTVRMGDVRRLKRE
ncbi:MAG: selenocysteine-specific translation elongation factor [Acidimicrobiia bacterium]|nr:selenocysteine-specific translation elongation factor [Acidimicrobiia bacterium]